MPLLGGRSARWYATWLAKFEHTLHFMLCFTEVLSFLWKTNDALTLTPWCQQCWWHQPDHLHRSHIKSRLVGINLQPLLSQLMQPILLWCWYFSISNDNNIMPVINTGHKSKLCKELLIDSCFDSANGDYYAMMLIPTWHCDIVAVVPAMIAASC